MSISWASFCHSCEGQNYKINITELKWRCQQHHTPSRWPRWDFTSWPFWTAFPVFFGSRPIPRLQRQCRNAICLSVPLLCYVAFLYSVKSLSAALDPMDSSLPGFSVHGIFQARVLEWVAISFSRGSSQPRDQTQVSCVAGRCFTLWATRDAPFRIYVITFRAHLDDTE